MMYLRELAVYADDAIAEDYKGGFVQRFHREACSVVEPYLVEIYRKVVTVAVAKVGFIFTNELKAPVEHSPQRRFHRWPFDFAAYTASSTREAKQRLVLDALHEAMIWIARHEDWANESFDAAYQTIIDRDFKFVGYSKKSWICPRKRFRVRLYFDWQLDGIDMFAVLFRNGSKDEIARQQLGTGIPMAGILHEYLNAGAWQSNTMFEVAVSIPFHKTWLADFAVPIATDSI